MNRRVFLTAIPAAFAGAAWCRYVEPSWFELTHTRVPMRIRKPTRVLHVSDLHVSDGMTAEDLEVGMRAGLAQRPDLICFTGDFVSSTSGFDRKGLIRILRRAVDTAPTYGILGNHDGGKWIARHGGSRSLQPITGLLESSGVRVLQNSAVEEPRPDDCGPTRSVERRVRC